MTWHLISRVIASVKKTCRAGVIRPMSDILPLLRDGNRLRSISQRGQRSAHNRHSCRHRGGGRGLSVSNSKHRNRCKPKIETSLHGQGTLSARIRGQTQGSGSGQWHTSSLRERINLQQHDNRQPDDPAATRGLGRGMAVLAWVALLVVLTLFFQDKLLGGGGAAAEDASRE